MRSPVQTMSLLSFGGDGVAQNLESQRTVIAAAY